MHYRYLAFNLFFILALAFPMTTSAGRPSHVENVTCPIDGELFKAELGGSILIVGKWLDGSAMYVNSAALLAKCPTSGFVMYKHRFSDAELAKLRSYVASDAYRRMTVQETSHYLAAKLKAHNGEDPRSIAHSMLAATWEAKPGNWARYESYLAEAIQSFDHAFAFPYTDRKLWFEDQCLAGELERKLGRFEEAKKRFLSLIALPELGDKRYKRIEATIRLQLKLISTPDRLEHQAP